MKTHHNDGGNAGSISRREILKAAALASCTGLAARASRASGSGSRDTGPGRAFDYRLLLGWINDNSSLPLSGKRWPITDVGRQTVSDYRTFLRVAKESGFNGITLWGLYASHSWTVPLQNNLVPERRRWIDQILEEAARQKIKVLHGLGVYSWGFEEIIKHDPTTARNEGRMAWGSFRADNGVAMCYHSESARQWMRDIVDLCVKEIGTQGFGFQSGDLGRCYCAQCKTLSDAEYHSRVIGETAEYVRRRHPGQILGLSAWGVDLGVGAEALGKMTGHLDFLTDVTDQSARKGHDYRRSLTSQLKCALGSLGGAVVVPPQRWARDRWFLPHAQMTGNSIRSLHADGGRAFEFFMGPMANPQFSLMTRFVGVMLNNPELSCEKALSQVVERLYAPKSREVSAGIVRWLMALENAYMSRVGDISSGEFDFEPLDGVTAGEPIYLTRLTADALTGYGNDLEGLAKQLPALASQCRHGGEMQAIGRCLDNVLRDVRQVQAKRTQRT